MENLIVNGDFEYPGDPSFGWILGSGATIFNNATLSRSPTHSVRMLIVGSFSQTVPTMIGSTYVLTFYLYPFLYPLTSDSGNVTITGIPNPFPLIGPIANTYNKNTIIFTATTTSTTITINDFRTNPDATILFDDFSLFLVPVICFSGNSTVLSKNIETGVIDSIPASAIEPNTHLVFSTKKRKFVPVKYNMATGLVKSILCIKKNALGENMPNEDFYVTSGHVIMIDGIPVKARHIPQAEQVKVKSQMVYSICTDDGDPILVNGLEVLSYKYDKMIQYIRSKHVSKKVSAVV